MRLIAFDVVVFFSNAKRAEYDDTLSLEQIEVSVIFK